MVLSLFIYSFRTFAFIRKNKYDIVWCENVKVLMANALLKFSGVKLVFNMWSCVNSKIGLKIITFISDHIIVEALFQKQMFESLKSPPVTVIYTQLDENIFKQQSQDKLKKDFHCNEQKKVIGFLGGARYSKGYDIFIKSAYNLVVNEGLTDLVFYVAGINMDDDLLNDPELTEKVKALGNNIVLTKWIEDKKSFYESIDIFISTSRSEGLPGAVREAMGFGLPVIATDVGGTREALGNTGLIIYEIDDERIAGQCAQYIKNLSIDNNKRCILGDNARKRAYTYFIGDNWVKELETVFDNQ
ncbi:hypothetical protein CHI08_02360 [Peribacillus simplex]|nr:hypothetical protein CHI08_02360 [Peribacillus simplex]